MVFKRAVRYSNGYRLIFKPDNPSAYREGPNKGYVYEHIYIATKFLNRQLHPYEVVHHLDMIRDNNEPNNLIVLSISDHSKLHGWIRRNLKTTRYCKICNKELKFTNKYCSIKCQSKDESLTKRPNMLTLMFLMSVHDSMLDVGKVCGVSDNAVRKWCRFYRISTKVNDYNLHKFGKWVDRYSKKIKN